MKGFIIHFFPTVVNFARVNLEQVVINMIMRSATLEPGKNFLENNILNIGLLNAKFVVEVFIEVIN
jgi:hypothetical protein